MKSTPLEIETHLPLTQRVFLILLALSDGDHHGYRLLQQAEALGRGRVSIKPGSLYEAIHSLAARGWIAATDNNEDDARGRRTYRLTDVGRGVFAAEAHRLADLVDDLRDRKLIRQVDR